MEWLLAIGDGVGALRLVVALEAYIGARSLEAEGRRWLEAGLALATDASVSLRIKALYGLVNRAGLLGDSQAALAAAEAGLALAPTESDPFIRGLAYYAAAGAWEWQGDPARALEAYEAGRPLLPPNRAARRLALTLASIANLRRASGDVQAAVAPLDEALSYYDRIQDRWGHATVLNHRAQLASALGEYAAAVQFYCQGFAAAETIADQRLRMDMIVGLADVAQVAAQPNGRPGCSAPSRRLKAQPESTTFGASLTRTNWQDARVPPLGRRRLRRLGTSGRLSPGRMRWQMHLACWSVRGPRQSLGR